MTIELVDIIRTVVIIIAVLAAWKVVKLAAKQWWHDRRLQYRRMKRRYGAQTTHIKPRRADNKVMSREIMEGLLGDDKPWPPDEGKPWPRKDYSKQEYTQTRKAAQ